jgi:hypothetical protein
MLDIYLHKRVGPENRCKARLNKKREEGGREGGKEYLYEIGFLGRVGGERGVHNDTEEGEVVFGVHKATRTEGRE